MQAVVYQIEQHSAKVIVVDSDAAILPNLGIKFNADVCGLRCLDVENHVERFTCTQRKSGNTGEIELCARQDGKRFVRVAVLF